MNKNDPTLPDVLRAVPGNLPAHPLEASPFHEVFAGEVQLREYWRVLVKYRRIIGGIIALFAVGALVFGFTRTPLYTAQSKVRIGSYEPVLAATKIEDLLHEQSRESDYLETQIQVIKSLSLADRVLQNPEIKEALEYGKAKGLFSLLFGYSDNESSDAAQGGSVGKYTTAFTVLKGYLDLIAVEPIRRTSLVNIKATTANPILSAEIANKHAQSYMEWSRDTRVDQQSRGLQFLRGQADELREKVADLEREIAEYAEANSIIALNKDENITAQKLSRLNQLLTDATAKRIETENIFREAESSLSEKTSGFEDNSTQVMRGDLARLEGEYRLLSQKFTPSYPKMIQLRAQIEALKSSIERQQGNITLQLKSKYEAAVEEEKRLKEELEIQKSQAFDLSRRQVQYNVLQREATTSRDLLESVLKQIKETSLSVESNASNVSIVDYAVVPLSPSYPNKMMILLVGILLGSGVGVGAAFLLNYLDNTIRTPEELSTYLRLPTLGVVPSFALEERPPAPGPQAGGQLFYDPFKWPPGTGDAVPITVSSPPAIKESGGITFLRDPKSLAAEAYRTIRTGILLSQAGEPPRTLLVSSAQSSEGKTTTAINLAASLASAGGKVVVIDADLRRPKVLQHFNLEEAGRLGLVEILTGQRTFAEVAIPDVVKRITVVPSGKIPPNPAELLGSMEMASLIDDLSVQFDYVIIDSPPVLPVTDSVILSRYVDGVVLVVKGASTPKRVVRDARDRLASVGARFLGVILNDVDVRSGDYYYYNRYYYSYYQQETAAGEAKRQAGGGLV